MTQPSRLKFPRPMRKPLIRFAKSGGFDDASGTRRAASDAAVIERRILLPSPGNLAPLMSGLPARLPTAACPTRAA